MQKTLTALVVAAGVAGFAGSAFAAGCDDFHVAQSSKPVVTADAQQSTPVVKTTTPETAKN